MGQSGRLEGSLTSRTVIDISLPVHPEMLVWPKDPPMSVEPAQRISRGDGANVSLLGMSTHTGTHVDPPLHFIDGAGGVDAIPLDALVGPAAVVDLLDVEREIGPAEIARTPDGCERALFHTRNSAIWREPSPAFPDSYVHVTTDGARAAVDRGIKLIGTDFLSIEKRGAKGHPTHVTLLSAGVAIVEGLDLNGVDAGWYELAVLPLRIVDGDGSPARAVLMRTA